MITMRSLILCFLVLFLFGCESTEQKQAEAPQIFTHFEPDYANHQNVDEPIPQKQQALLIEEQSTPPKWVKLFMGNMFSLRLDASKYE